MIVAGRRTFEQAEGWGGRHPTGAPVIVVTHRIPKGWPREGAAVSFVPEGIETAMKHAAAIAGDGVIALATPSIIQQCLNLGLVDRIHQGGPAAAGSRHPDVREAERGSH